ncbi:MAG: AlpA family phage regulatory protein [Betaproteobacteria bacterium]|nr:AlpA family phage regulatory protein [Betaproteobacteria bacterium]
MRMLSKRQVREMVLYSPGAHRQARSGRKFPKRVQLGPSRVGWVESEVEDWLKERIAKRTP